MKMKNYFIVNRELRLPEKLSVLTLTDKIIKKNAAIVYSYLFEEVKIYYPRNNTPGIKKSAVLLHTTDIL